jgi:hypothetical protein
VTGRSLPILRPCSRAASMGRWVGNQESAGKLHREISRVVGSLISFGHWSQTFVSRGLGAAVLHACEFHEPIVVETSPSHSLT